jgi:hypothetical protein
MLLEEYECERWGLLVVYIGHVMKGQCRLRFVNIKCVVMRRILVSFERGRVLYLRCLLTQLRQPLRLASEV